MMYITKGHEIEFEIESMAWVKGSVIYMFPHINQNMINTVMCVILKHTENTQNDGIYYVRSIGQCRGWR